MPPKRPLPSLHGLHSVISQKMELKSDINKSLIFSKIHVPKISNASATPPLNFARPPF
jgi:hypothetical protein